MKEKIIGSIQILSGLLLVGIGIAPMNLCATISFVLLFEIIAIIAGICIFETGFKRLSKALYSQF